MGCSLSAASPQVNEGDFIAVAAGDPLPGQQQHQQHSQATPVRAAMDDQTTTTALAPGATEVPIQRAHSGRELLSMAARCPATNTMAPSRPPATHVVGDTPATVPNPVSAALPPVPASEAISPVPASDPTSPPPPPRTSHDVTAVATPSSGDTAPPPSLRDQQHRSPLMLPPAASDDHLHQQAQPHHTSSHQRHRPPSSRVGQPPRPQNITLLADLTSSVLSPDQVVTPHQRRRRTNGGGNNSLRIGFDHRTPSGPTSPTVAGATDAAVWDDETTRNRSMASLLSDDVRMSSGSEVHPSITQWLCDIERSNA